MKGVAARRAHRLPHAVRRRLSHDTNKSTKLGTILNRESIAFAHLYQHAESAVRDTLWVSVTRNPCSCLECLLARGPRQVGTR